jgi:hypothetical protein
MYTLWDKTVINCKNYTSESYTFLKNVSKSLDKVKELYPGLTVDESLRGNVRIERMVYKPSEDVDKFNYGKYKGELLTSVNDINYLIWYLNGNNGNDAQIEWAKENLESVRFYDGWFRTIEEYNKIMEQKAKAETLFNKIKAEKSITCTAVSNIMGGEFLYVEYGDVKDFDIVVKFTGESRRFTYNGYEYYLPVVGGKAKRIKNKSIKVVIDDIKITENGFGLLITANSIDLSK